MGFLGKLRWEKQKLKQRAHYEEELKKAEARKHGHVEPLFQPLQALRGSPARPLRNSGSRCSVIYAGSPQP